MAVAVAIEHLVVRHEDKTGCGHLHQHHQKNAADALKTLKDASDSHRHSARYRRLTEIYTYDSSFIVYVYGISLVL